MPVAMARGWRDRLVDVLRTTLPQVCALCAAPTGTALICSACAGGLARLQEACPCCALPSTGSGRCGRCLADPPAFDRSHAPYVYAFPLDRLVQAFKYHGTLAYADWFAQTMLEYRPDRPAADLLIPVPLARRRQRERGFNQALEIAKPLSRWTGIPLSVDTALRVRDTPPQASLPWRERAQNIRGAFACAHALTGKRVVVVDDVMTTGASLDEFARTLKGAGAASVENWLIARTLPPAGD